MWGNTKLDYTGLLVIGMLLKGDCLALFALEEFQGDKCFQGETDLQLWELTYGMCLDECRSRETCVAMTMHVETHHCLIHEDPGVSQVECPSSGFLSSAKSSWLKKQHDACICATGQFCNSVTRECEKKECPPAEPLDNGVLLGNQRYIGAKISYVCNHGHSLIGSSSNTCQDDASWERSVPVCESDARCVDGWTQFEDYCYKFQYTTMSRPTAQAQCEGTPGGHLVDIKTEAEWNFIKDLFQSTTPGGTSYVWIGAHTASPTGHDAFRWTDGTRMVDGFYIFGTMLTRSCVYFRPHAAFIWENHACSLNYWSMCEAPLVL